MTKKLMAAVLVLGFSALYAGDNKTANNGTDLQTMQQMFQKKMKRKCRMSSARLAQSHTVEEWKKIKADGRMDEEIYRICPRFPREILTNAQYEAIKGYIIQYGRGTKLQMPNG
jgi:hypothetical protein